MNPIESKIIGDFRVDRFQNCSNITRKPTSSIADQKAYKDHFGNIIVDECKTFTGACRKAKCLNEILHPESNPEKYALAVRMAAITNAKYAGAEVAIPAIFMEWSISQMKKFVEDAGKNESTI